MASKQSGKSKKFPEKSRKSTTKVGSKSVAKTMELLVLCRSFRNSITADKMSKFVKMVKDGSVNVNLKDSSERGTLRTPLHFLCRYYQDGDSIDFIRLLIQKGADVNARTHKGKSPLHYLCKYYTHDNLVVIIELLTENGADVNAKAGYTRQTPLHLLCQYYSKESLIELVKLLIEKGASVKAKTNEGYTPLHSLCTHYSYNDNIVDIAKLLIAKGAKVKTKAKMSGLYSTPLHLLCKYYKGDNFIDVLRLMIVEGADINAKAAHGYNSFHLLCAYYNNDNIVNIVQLLIENGADLNATTEDGETPLHLMCARQRTYNQFTVVDLVKSLVLHGSRVNAKTSYGKTPLHLLCKNCRNGHLIMEITKILVKGGADINAMTENGNYKTPLHYLLKYYKNDDMGRVVKFFVRKGAKTYTKAHASAVETPRDRYPNIVFLGADVPLSSMPLSSSISTDRRTPFLVTQDGPFQSYPTPINWFPKVEESPTKPYPTKMNHQEYTTEFKLPTKEAGKTFHYNSEKYLDAMTRSSSSAINVSERLPLLAVAASQLSSGVSTHQAAPSADWLPRLGKWSLNTSEPKMYESIKSGPENYNYETESLYSDTSELWVAEGSSFEPYQSSDLPIAQSYTDKSLTGEQAKTHRLGKSKKKLSYISRNIIGRGSFGTVVYHGFVTQNYVTTRVAVKRIQLSNVKDQFIQRIDELESLLKVGNLDHPNILPYLCIESDDNFLLIATELCAGTLQDWLENKYSGPPILDEREILFQVTQGLDHLHKNGIIHRDITPTNILVSKPEGMMRQKIPKIKVVDFGLCNDVITDHRNETNIIIKRGNLIRNPLGTEGWMAPELYHSDDHDSKVDIFSLGILFYYWLTGGEHPFGKDINTQTVRIINKEPTIVMPEALKSPYSEDLSSSELIQWMLEMQPGERPTTQEILDHDFFLDNQQKRVSSSIKMESKNVLFPGTRQDIKTQMGSTYILGMYLKGPNQYKRYHHLGNAGDSV